MMRLQKVRCPRCRHSWVRMVERPRKCPNCQVKWPLGKPETIRTATS